MITNSNNQDSSDLFTRGLLLLIIGFVEPVIISKKATDQKLF